MKRISAEKATLKKTTPQGPKSLKRDLARAEPNWTDRIDSRSRPIGEGLLMERFMRLSRDSLSTVSGDLII